jgi:hypothetical protein
MTIEKTEGFLKKFDYKFQKQNQFLIIKMDYAHTVLIDFSNPKKILISDKLNTYNFLTGIIKMSIKKAVLFNMVFTLILSIGLAFINVNIGIIVFFGFTLWGVLWSIFYVSKFENLKYILISSNH